MTTAPVNGGRHVCVLVQDIPTTADELELSLGLTFEEPRTLQTRLRLGEAELDMDVTYAYSIDRSTELLRAVGDAGPFSEAEGLGFHHFGARVQGDLREAIARERSSGATLECELFLGDHLLAAFFKPTATRPFRFELVSPPPR